MRPTITAAAVVIGGTLAWTSVARAQEASYTERRVRAPSEAFELKLGTAYTQGFGMVAPGRGMPNVAGAGLALGLDLDYRITHAVSFGLEGQYQELTNEQNSAARGVALNFGVTWHAAPVMRGDPWLRLGTGYRMLWEVDPVAAVGTTVMRHGFELGTAKLGYDFRIGEDVALAPVIGADLNLFLWEAPSNGSSHALSAAQVATFVFAGIQGRFDMGGNRGVMRGTMARR